MFKQPLPAVSIDYFTNTEYRTLTEKRKTLKPEITFRHKKMPEENKEVVHREVGAYNHLALIPTERDKWMRLFMEE